MHLPILIKMVLSDTAFVKGIVGRLSNKRRDFVAKFDFDKLWNSLLYYRLMI